MDFLHCIRWLIILHWHGIDLEFLPCLPGMHTSSVVLRYFSLLCVPQQLCAGTDSCIYTKNHSDVSALTWTEQPHTCALTTLQCYCWSERGGKGLESFPTFISAQFLLFYVFLCHFKNFSVLLGNHRGLKPTKYKPTMHRNPLAL